MRAHHALLAGTMTLAALTAADDAFACHGSDSDAEIAECFAALHAGVATLAFVPADIYYASEGRWLSPVWAWTQFWLGGIVTIGAAGSSLHLALEEENAGIAAGSAALMALGGFYGSVALFSIQKYTPPQAEQAKPQALLPSWVPTIVMMPTADDGVMVTATF